MHEIRENTFKKIHDSSHWKTRKSAIKTPECLRHFSQTEKKWDQNNREQAKKKLITGLKVQRTP